MTLYFNICPRVVAVRNVFAIHEAFPSYFYLSITITQTHFLTMSGNHENITGLYRCGMPMGTYILILRPD